MKIEQIVADPLASFIYLERYVNSGSPSGFSGIHQVSDRYRPSHNLLTFDLPVLLVPEHSVVAYGDFEYVRKAVPVSPGFLPIPIHPDIFPQIKDLGRAGVEVVHVAVQPTASQRTVLVLGPSPLFLKLHYPRPIGRFSREMPLYKWLGARDSGYFFREYRRQVASGFGLFDETAGVFVVGGDNNFGTTFRKFPATALTPGRLLIPAFSLFAHDSLEPASPPLLQQLIIKYGLSIDWFLLTVVRRLLVYYVEIATSHGLIPECNAQNLVIGLDIERNMGIELYIRDMEDVWKDNTVRQSLGLENSCVPYHTISETDEDFFKRRSFLFDFKLGEYLLDPLIGIASDAFGVSRHVITKQVSDISRELWSSHPGYFGSTKYWYRYPRAASVSREYYERATNPRYR